MLLISGHGELYSVRYLNNLLLQFYALRDIQVAAREGCCVNKMTNRAVIRLDEILISMCRSSRVTTFRFTGKTQ